MDGNGRKGASGATGGICVLTGSGATVGKLEAGERDAFPESDFG